jgi:hypothetical protein
VKILTEPKNALVKQYQKVFAFEDVELEFTDDGLQSRRRSGAAARHRGPRSAGDPRRGVAQHDVRHPGRTDIGKVVIDAETVHTRRTRRSCRARRASARAGLRADPPDGSRTHHDDGLRRRARVPRRPRVVRQDRPHRQPERRTDPTAVRGDGRPAPRLSGDPRHRHERQGVDRADDQPAAHGQGADRRHLHQPAPGAHQRADQAQRRADLRRGVRGADRRHRRSRADHGCPPHLLRGGHRRCVPLVRGRGRRRGRRRGRDARSVGCDEHREQPGRGGDQHRARPHRVRRTVARRHRPREGRHHQAGERRRDRRDRPRARADLPRRGGCHDARARRRLRDGPTTRWRSVAERSTCGRRRRSIPTCSSRCTVPIRARTHRSRSPRSRRSSPRRSSPTSSTRGSRTSRCRAGSRCSACSRSPSSTGRTTPGCRRVRGVFFGDFDPEGRRILVIGTLRDPVEMVAAIRADEFDVVHACTAPSPRGVPGCRGREGGP